MTVRVRPLPATVIDRQTYCAFANGRLQAFLDQHQVDTLIASGGETDVCVLATAGNGAQSSAAVGLMQCRVGVEKRGGHPKPVAKAQRLAFGRTGELDTQRSMS